MVFVLYNVHGREYEYSKKKLNKALELIATDIFEEVEEDPFYEK